MTGKMEASGKYLVMVKLTGEATSNGPCIQVVTSSLSLSL